MEKIYFVLEKFFFFLDHRVLIGERVLIGVVTLHTQTHTHTHTFVIIKSANPSEESRIAKAQSLAWKAA